MKKRSVKAGRFFMLKRL